MKRKPKFGQNFLIDDRARHAVADALGDVRERTVIEIGPGHGAITSILAGRCARLVAIELDPHLAAELRFKFRDHKHVKIVEADVLAIDLGGLLGTGETADVVGNLPYYITSDILLQVCAGGAAGFLRRAVVMMQREVAERVAAAPGVREYGLLSATVQMNGLVESLFTLEPSAFSPPPDVHSSVIRVDFKQRFTELGVDREGFDRFLKQIFAQKRKTLENNLRAAGYGADAIDSAWPGGLSRQVRAEAIGLEPMAELYRGLVHSVELGLD